MQTRSSVFDGIDDLLIAGAAAQVAADGFTYIRFARLRNGLEQGVRCDQHAGCAIPALQCVRMAKAILQCAWRAICIAKPFDSGDAMTVGLHGEHEARAHRITVEQNRACAAYAMFAADMRAGQAQLVSQPIDER